MQGRACASCRWKELNRRRSRQIAGGSNCRKFSGSGRGLGAPEPYWPLAGAGIEAGEGQDGEPLRPPEARVAFGVVKRVSVKRAKIFADTQVGVAAACLPERPPNPWESAILANASSSG